ncbi:hydrogenase nickel incorporation protein HypB [Nocardia arizonensis]|uniref:hydrogenase nickel incorporation protein HypB n=1 Tax=Nocardia arizonensis TaxID=1141647 RepID=UPI0006D27D69|nr:hydrogenase nickel incorporation protein HypB [Nocardia arizonensis]
MCATCGCGNDTAVITISGDRPHEHGAHQHGAHQHDGHEHDGGHDHVHPHDHEHAHQATETVSLEQKVLAKNDEAARHIRNRLERSNILALNITSSPGAGKTTLLERTIRDLAEIPIAVIEGDQETVLDAERIRATGRPVVQVNTGAGCHLDAEMMGRALDALMPEPATLLLIENVGNLVCPALFDLGERGKVVVISVTEGDDKPLKYPHMFAAARLVLINKTDLLPYVDFNPLRFREYADSVNPGIEIIPVSAVTGAGLSLWYDWLRRERRASKSTAIDDLSRQT